MPVEILTSHAAECVSPAIERGITHLLTCSTGREKPLTLDAELLTLHHPRIEIWFELFRKSIAVDVLAKTEALRLNGFTGLIQCTTAHKVFIFEVIHFESTQLCFTATAAHCKSNGTRLFVLTGCQQIIKELVQNLVAPDCFLPYLLHSRILNFSNCRTEVLKLILVIKNVLDIVRQRRNCRLQAANTSWRVPILVMIKRTIKETVREYDADGKVVRETVTETTEDDDTMYFPQFQTYQETVKPWWGEPSCACKTNS